MNTNKVRRSFLLTVFAIAAISVAACNSTPEGPAKPAATPTPAASPAASATPAASPAASPNASPVAGSAKVEALVGRWAGPEGTYLNVTKKADKYSVEIADLNGPKTFEGTAKGDTIEFTRDGKAETIKAATGAETGMKGFEKDTNCVVVNKGKEGFCKK